MLHPLDGLDLTEIYKPRKWKMYEVEIGGVEYNHLCDCDIVGREEDLGLKVCGASSPMALDWFDKKNSVDGLLFYDTEQVAMGLDSVYGVMLSGPLLKEWRGHSVGAIVLMITKGVHEGKFTVCIEER